MKLAITADVHLAAYRDTPERYHALEDIAHQAEVEAVEVLLICGDLFDRDFANYADFEQLCNAFPALQFWVLPGNHDAGLSSRALSGRNIRVFEKPEMVDAGRQMLLIPYEQSCELGEKIAGYAGSLSAGKWVLFSHGDYLQGNSVQHASETGRYMPLARADLERYRPVRAFLGHIHAAADGEVCYPGSPCGLDISETGPRRFLVYDTATNTLSGRTVNTDVLYDSLEFTILPVGDEESYIQDTLRLWLATRRLTEYKEKARLRVRVTGYSRNRSALLQVIEKELTGYRMYHDESVDISGVAVTADYQKIDIAEKTRSAVMEMVLPASPDEPDHDMVLQKALQVIFGG